MVSTKGWTPGAQRGEIGGRSFSTRSQPSRVRRHRVSQDVGAGAFDEGNSPATQTIPTTAAKTQATRCNVDLRHLMQDLEGKLRADRQTIARRHTQLA